MGKSSIDINGYRRQEANPISMVGVFPYTGKQIDYDGSLRLDPHKIYWVLRPPEELFHPDAIKSFNGLPIRIGHVMLGAGFKSVDDEPVDGCIYNVRQSLDMPEYLIGDFSIYTDKMKEVLQKGRVRELSLGYRCQYIPESGVYNGQPYEFKQANLRGNHLALVENGRCGSSVRVCDEAILTFDSLPEEVIKMTEEEKIKKAKKLADALRNGDVSVCEDCLDFITYAHDDRLEVLEALAEKKKGKKGVEEAEEVEEVAEPKAEDVSPKKDKDEGVVVEEVEETVEPVAEDGCGGKKKGGKASKAKDEIPPPPPVEEKPEEKKDAPPPAAPAVPSEPAPAPAPADIPPPAPKQEKVPLAAAPAKDAEPTAPVTTPSIPAPLSKVEGVPEKEPKAEDGKMTTCAMCGKDSKECECEAKEPKAEDSEAKEKKGKLEEQDLFAEVGEVAKDCGGKKTEDGGITKEPLGGAPKPMPEKEETFGESNTAMDGVAPDVFAKVAAECERARKLAAAVGQMGIAIDSAGKREIEVAREAVKQIPSLSFAVDAADEQVLMAVRGAIAARADELARARNNTVTLLDSPAVTQDSSPSTPTARDVDKALAAYFGK